jgi:nitrate reductase NapAB chaperone NapD
MSNNSIIVPTNPKDLERIKSAIKEASDCHVRIEGEKDELKSIAEVMAEELNIPKGIFNKMVKIYHSQTYDKLIADTEDFSALYEAVLNNGKKAQS